MAIVCAKCGSDDVITATLRVDQDPECVCDKCREDGDPGLRVDDLLRRLKHATSRSVKRSVDAASCGTSWDFKRADEAELYEACVYDAVAEELTKRIARGGR